MPARRKQTLKDPDYQSNTSPPSQQPAPRRKQKNPASNAKTSQLWDPQTDYARCFLRKIPSTVKGGLEELGCTASTRAQDREDHLEVIAEEDEESDNLNDSARPIVIDLPKEEHKAPEEVDTNHDSEGDKSEVAPNYDERLENTEDPKDPTMTLESTSGNKYHTSASRKKANRLNELISKANFLSRWVARSTAWRRHFSRIAKSFNVKVLPLTPGYNATQWNAEFDSLNRLVKARKYYGINCAYLLLSGCEQTFGRRP
ncbi:uncharacterized protein MELLADRAFT_106837 [Melampsora larici-populina 98AG31]|uniref:Uncharacterized protein n=1 Tax=Melampsora larici-populina (strain 98AG31 / pathotype 3-4-7) TaxID=747676 RepID=F4RMT0_MELLP|nr:uncharacterized protein MELLADRAFT_106837 [Melampsora larici-populina 98AG31]EGG06163.1 hypothetical protein MELLADRAFT_106837 [Melampsora larici-populina 98AG31]